MNSHIVESIQKRICFACCALCKEKMEHNLYLSGASFYYTPNWIECRDEFTKLIASCASVLRASNIFIYSFGGWRRVNSKQLAGHLNGDQICPEARKLLRHQGKEGRKGSGFLVALQCKYLFRARASSLGLWPGKQSRSVACVMRPVAYA